MNAMWITFNVKLKLIQLLTVMWFNSPLTFYLFCSACSMLVANKASTSREGDLMAAWVVPGTLGKVV